MIKHLTLEHIMSMQILLFVGITNLLNVVQDYCI